MDMGFLVQGLGKLIGTSKSGIKVFEKCGTYGDRILTSFKPGAVEPHKQVIRYAPRIAKDAYPRQFPYRLDKISKDVTVLEAGKKPIEISTTINNWFFNGQLTRTNAYGLRVQSGHPDISWVKETLHIKDPLRSYKTNISVFENKNMINHKYL